MSSLRHQDAVVEGADASAAGHVFPHGKWFMFAAAAIFVLFGLSFLAPSFSSLFVLFAAAFAFLFVLRLFARFGFQTKFLFGAGAIVFVFVAAFLFRFVFASDFGATLGTRSAAMKSHWNDSMHVAAYLSESHDLLAQAHLHPAHLDVMHLNSAHDHLHLRA